MPELTKKPLTDGRVRFCVTVPRDKAANIQKALEGVLALLDEPGEDTRGYAVDEVFPDMTPGKVLRGARGLAGLTQAQLAAKVGAHKSHISEMERGVRTIGKDMAKRLAKALNMPYKAFL